MMLYNYLSPAKLNLFLHINGNRLDGYHLLQTVYQMIGLYDIINFTLRKDNKIISNSEQYGIPSDIDLTIKAASLLNNYTKINKGVNIKIDKYIPIGSGLGGGSSNAATTLLILNRLWKINLSRLELYSLSKKLGADVPFFIFGKNGFAEGIGESIIEINLPICYYLIIIPSIIISTAKIFADNSIIKNTERINPFKFLYEQNINKLLCKNFGKNDMQFTVMKKYREVKEIINFFINIANPRMSGSGSSVFLSFSNIYEARLMKEKLPIKWKSIIVPGLVKHPLYNFAG